MKNRLLLNSIQSFVSIIILLMLVFTVTPDVGYGGKLIDRLRANHLCDNNSTKLAQKRWGACSSQAPKIDVTDKEHGDTFPCDCWTSKAIGGEVLNIRRVNRYDDTTVENGVKYVAVFSPGERNNENCMCGVVTDLVGDWHATIQDSCLKTEKRTKKVRRKGLRKRYKTVHYDVCVERGPQNIGYPTGCVGLCGAHCGIDDRGIFIDEWNKRYASLVIHDVCQAYINSTDSMADKEGRKNNCGDEGSKSGGAARDAMGGVGTIFATGFFNGHCGPKCREVKENGGNVCDN
ncbi:MAG: hypothetical protein ACOH5I_10845 [Oligoflexus sp.]